MCFREWEGDDFGGETDDAQCWVRDVEDMLVHSVEAEAVCYWVFACREVERGEVEEGKGVEVAAGES